MEIKRYSMELADYADNWIYNIEHHCWCLTNVVYCEKPLAPQLQCMNIYVPAVYLRVDGTVDTMGKVGRYAAETAPIVLENCIGGYSECEPWTIDSPRGQGAQCLAAGLVYVSVGARGKQTKDTKGEFIGKSPAGLVDLKSAVRFLKHNRSVMPGNVERVVSIGVSAGGAMSSLLGCTGNDADYLPLLEEIGAVMNENDDVYAAQCYCPIIDLEHADIAYEWMFRGVHTCDGMPNCPGGDFTLFQKALSDKLATMYPAYFNGLGLTDPDTGDALLLENDGRGGTAYTYLLGVLEEAVAKHLKKLENEELPLTCTVNDYLCGNYTYRGFLPRRHSPDNNVPSVSDVPNIPVGMPPLTELPGSDTRTWLSWDGRKAKITSIDALWQTYVNRLKPCTSFDALNNRQAENQEFGNKTTDYMHFDTYIAKAVMALKEEFPQECEQYSAAYVAVENDEELERRKYLINPLRHIGTDAKGNIAPYYRIRVGAHDPHTSFTMAMILALKLKATGKTNVDYAMVWDEDHGPADYQGELCAWIGSIV